MTNEVDDQAALEALYEQFRCLASVEFKNDPMKLGAAIDRAAYSECVAYLEVGSNVIFDKMFEVYDTDKNGLIGFQEFVVGIHVLKKDQKRKLQCPAHTLPPISVINNFSCSGLRRL